MGLSLRQVDHMDIVRVLRVLEYVGPRDVIEEHLKKCLHGTKVCNTQTKDRFEIRVATVGLTPDIIEMGKLETMLPPVTAKKPEPLRNSLRCDLDHSKYQVSCPSCGIALP